MSVKVELSQVVDKIKQLDSFVVVTHISPDADAIGSSVSLAMALRSLGKEASVYFPEKNPEKFKDLVDESLLFYLEAELKTKLVSSALIGVDCATKKRLGDEVGRCFDTAPFVINIDHHASNENWGAMNWVVTNSPASANLVFDLISSLGASFSPQIANLIFAGLMDDTGSFRYSNTSKHAFDIAGKLVAAGAEPAKVSNLLYFQTPERVLRLRAQSLSTLEVFSNGQIALLYVTNEFLKQSGCTSEDTEGLVDLVRSIEGVKIALFAREIEDGFKVSIRSKDEQIDVNAFAGQFGGGGHKAASGFTMKMKLADVLKTLRQMSPELLK